MGTLRGKSVKQCLTWRIGCAEGKRRGIFRRGEGKGEGGRSVKLLCDGRGSVRGKTMDAGKMGEKLGASGGRKYNHKKKNVQEQKGE